MPHSTASLLAEYDKKRDFSKNAEPAPSELEPRSGPLVFTIQKHAATRLHYDFRLEIDGVLKSWPIPKGPSYSPEDKRLAVMTEDHPLDYANFEGLIPKGEYGGGEVIVWDAGIFAPEEGGVPVWDREKANEMARKGVERGRLTVFLHGRKMNGLWTLIKTSRGPKEWLFLKKEDGYEDAKRDVVEDEQASVLSGLTIDDLKGGRLPDRVHPPTLLLEPGQLGGAKKVAKLPESVEPMLPTLTERAFAHPDWLFEPKLDGYRMICVVQAGGGVRLFSRRGLEATKDYAWLGDELRRQPYDNLILDGEIVALDENGRPSFQRMQNARGDKTIFQQFFAFDILFRDGVDVRGATFEERRKLLEATVVPTAKIRLVDVYPEAGVTLFEIAKASGLEGVVGKKRDSRYETGRRSPQWLKVKTTDSDEFVIGGISKGTGARGKTFGAIIVGQYDSPSAKKLTYKGHTGSGFDDKTLDSLHKRLLEMQTDESPFDAEVPLDGRWTKREKVQPTWVRPELVAEIKFTERTDDGILRNPVFMRLREDKAAQDVRQSDVVAPPIEKAVAKAEMAPAPKATSATKTKARAKEEEAPSQPGPATPIDSKEYQAVLDQLEGSKGHKQLLLEVEGYKIPLSNLDKVMWPAWEDRWALTKRDLAIYFAKMAPHLLRHLKDRPLTLVRFPNGIKGGSFYQKHYAQPQPPFVETVMLYSDHNAGDGQYILCNNLATLIWLGQIADLELHSWYSRVNPEPDGHGKPLTFAGSIENMKQSLLNYPDFIVFDLDPYLYSGQEAKGEEPEFHPKGFSATCETAYWLKEVLDGMGLSSFVKTTGKTGLHIYVPIQRTLDYHATHAISETISRFLAQAHPNEVTIDWTVKNRPGKVFADYNQNVRGKTLASIYSPRVQPWAGVSMPVRWEELKTVMPPDFNLLSAPERMAEVGDLWAGILDAKHDLAGMLG